MEKLNISEELKSNVEDLFFNKYEKERSLAEKCIESIYEDIDCWGRCDIVFHKYEEYEQYTEFAYREPINAYTLEEVYAEVLLAYLSTDEGLRVNTVRDEHGVITSITITLNYSGV